MEMGKADIRQELFRGWATNDTHAGPSNLHYGFDNWIYGSVGYAGFNGVVNGERVNFRQGFYRFKVEPENSTPNTPPSLPGKGAGGLGSESSPPSLPKLGSSLKVTKLEFLRSTNNNTWGLAFDESGQLFGSTANGCPIVHMPIPNRYYEKVKGLTSSVLQNIAPDNHFEPITDKVRQVDWHGGFTAASNCAVYTARTYPREYWNRVAFVSEPTGHLTTAFTLQPNGTSYAARYGWNLIASDDEWSAPIDAQVGPDGHVWVIDWYNYIVQHNPTPAGFRTGKGRCLRNGSARQEARPHLSCGLHQSQARAAGELEGCDTREAGRNTHEPQPDVATPRSAASGGGIQVGRRFGVAEAAPG
jgi:hypothetical protein